MNTLLYKFLFCGLVLITTTVSGQIIPVSGPSSSNVGETHTYSVFLGSISPVSATWTAFGGVVDDQTIATADVTWNEVIDDNRVTYFMEDEFGEFYLGVRQVSVAVPIPNTTFTITKNCGSTNVLRNTNPNASYDWYWQSSSNGTSTTMGSGSSITLNADGPLFLRARTKNGSNKWSVAQSVGTINIVEAAPTPGSIGTGTAICVGAAAPTLTSASAPTGDETSIQWKKQTAADGTNWPNVQSNGNNLTYPPGNLSVQTSYKRDVTNVCGTVSSNIVIISMKSIPDASLSLTTEQICSGQSTTAVSITNPNSVPGTTFSWTISAPDISGINTTTTSGTTIPPQTLSTAFSSNRVAVYAVTPSAAGCSGTAKTFTVTVKPKPTVAVSPSTQSICSGQTMATVSISNPNGVPGTTFAWTVSASSITGATNGSGTSIAQTLSQATNSNKTATYTITATANACASSTGESVVTVKPIPTVAATPAAQNVCPGLAMTAISITNPNAVSGTTFGWTVSAPNITGASSGSGNSILQTLSQSTTTNKTATYTITPTANGCPGATTNASVTVYPPLLGGTVGSDQTICINSDVAAFTSSVAASGGNGTYTYQWQMRPPGGTWANISGATSATYNHGNLASPQEFRRQVTACTLTAHSNTITIGIHPTVTGGSIGSNQSICTNTDVAAFTSTTAPGGGNGSYTYQWQMRPPGGTWANISGATAITYNHGNLSATQEFQRLATSCSQTTPGNTITVTIYPAIVAGSIGSNQTICYNANVAAFTSTAAASGGSGSYTYQWQSRPPAGTWTNIAGATGVTYDHGNLTNTTEFRRGATSCSQTQYTTGVTVTVDPLSAGGTLSPSIEAYCSATGSMTVSGVTGTIQNWESRVGAGSWVPIANTTSGLSYTNVSATTSYRVWVKSGVCAATTSNEAIVTIVPPVLTVQGSAAIAPGSNTQLTTQTGLYSYQWYQDNQAIGGTTNALPVTKPGVYKVTVKASSTGPSCTTNNITITSTVDQQPLSLNYIITNDFFKEGLDGAVDLFDLAPEDFSQNIQYFDGLGRHMQSVSLGASPAGRDIVQPVVYDEFGREAVKYLPYSRGVRDGRYVPGALTEQSTFYQTPGTVANDPSPFAVTIFEPSPLNRVIEQGAPGSAWQPNSIDSYSSTDPTIKKSYETNAVNEVLLWTYTYPTALLPLGLVNTGTASTPTYYGTSELYKNKTKDEQHNEVIEYVDKHGRTVLKRVQATSTANASTTDANRDTNWASTYYIYDDFGSLVCVIPPEATKLLSTQYYHLDATDETKDTFMKQWAFRYTYDVRRRVNMKQVPGAGTVYMVYDNRDRLVMTQDGNQRAESTKYWTFTKYDVLNRPVLTGIYISASTLTQMQDAVSTYYAPPLTSSKAWYETFTGAGPIHGYDNKSFPQVTDPNSYLTVTYYDSYAFRSSWVGEYAYISDALTQTVNGVTYNQPGSEDSGVTGQITGAKVKVLDGGVTGGYAWLKTINYYDDKYRVVQIKGDNYKGGLDRTSNLYDFTGKVLKTKTTHVERDIVWKDMVGVKQEGNKLIRTAAGSGWGPAGAVSVQQLPAGTDGWMEFQASETNLARMLALSDQNTNASYTALDYAWYTTNGGTLYIYESGTSRGAFGAYAPGDVLKIERTGSTVRYYQNNILMYTSTVASSSALMVDAAFHTVNSTIVNVRTSFSETVRTINRRFEYDHAGRLLETWHKLDIEPEVLLTRNEYNEIGQLITKKLHSRNTGSSFTQNIDYRYNIRGWLDNINDVDTPEASDLFSMDLNYQNPSAQGGTAQYNGNISEIRWNGAGSGKQSYGYRYDNMNRMTKANYYAANHTLQNGRYDEWIGDPDTNVPGYDLNGNIEKLYRYGEKDATPQGRIDELGYHYVGNQLKIVNDGIGDNANEEGFKELTEKTFNAANIDSENEYAYDANGNMTKDDNKGITAISYNYLNLPSQVNKGASDYIMYIYDATGRKLTQQVFGSTAKKTDYVGDFIYENDTLQFINHEEGRILPAISGNATYQYHLKDHLGNVRVTFSEASTSTPYLATFERTPASIETNENSLFLNMNNIKKVNASMYNHTPGGGKSYSYRLSGVTGEVVGPAKSFAVSSGDMVDMEVYARYNAPTTTNSDIGTFTSALIGAFGLNPAGGAGVDGSQAHTAFSDLFTAGAWIASGDYEDQVAPKAFINYLLFDQNFVLVDAGFDQVTQAAAASHDYLSLHIKVEQAGYLYIYLSNENAKIQDVYFDDFKVTHHTLVEQSDDYYPFGLTFNSYSRENTTLNKFKFQGQEHIDDLNLGWDSFKWRNYMPDIGRFFNVDPLADKYVFNSPYAFSENHVTTHVELEGLEKMHFQAALNQGEQYVSTVNFTVDMKESKVNVTKSSAINPFFLEGKNLIEHGELAVVDFEPEMKQNEDGSFDVHGDLSFFGATDLNLNIKIVDSEVVIQTNVDDIGSNMGVTVMVADETVDEANHLQQVNVGAEKPVKQFSDRELNQTTTIPLQGNPSEKIVFDQEKMQEEKKKNPQN